MREMEVPGTATPTESLRQHHDFREIAMAKPKGRARRRSVEQEQAKDDEARLETFERGTEQRNDDTLSRPDTPDSLAPENPRLDLND
jgi:hypothetical protein